MTGSAPLLPALLADLAAGRLRVLGQATRIRLIGELEHGERTIREIADALGTTQQNISQHLGVLHQAGVLAREKRGNRVVYRLVDPYFGEIIERVLASLRPPFRRTRTSHREAQRLITVHGQVEATEVR